MTKQEEESLTEGPYLFIFFSGLLNILNSISFATFR